MRALRKLWAVVVTCAAPIVTGALLAVPLGGCGNSAGGKVATVQSGDMPSGAKWDGVYFSELYGYLHLVDKGGNHIKGKWERPHKDKWGEFDGEATGDLVHFSWTEYNRGLVGPNAKKSGKGYFKYKRPAGDNVDDELTGEIGAGEDEVGDPWEAKKQRNIPPNPDSIVGSGAGDVGGGDWDSDSKEKGKPESPSSPH